jgi:hypothetical protein
MEPPPEVADASPQYGSTHSTTVDARTFYDEYHGHPVPDLETVHSALRAQNKSIVFFAGDSSLDNKYWFSDTAPAVNGYEAFLRPPRMKQDVCYALNSVLAADASAPYAAINSAIEATALNHRACGRLLPQDDFIRRNITEDDMLIVSVGGNDVALQPLLCTVCSALGLVWCGGPVSVMERCACACPPSIARCCDLGCVGCGVPNCLSATLCGFPLGLGYMVDLFKNRVEHYVRRLLGDARPKKVMVCMIYFLDEAATGSWSDAALSCLCYNQMPWRLQAGIRKAFELGTKKIRIPGVEVVPFPLYEVLDGKTSSDYRQRVEPSPSGGRKMAEAMHRALFRPRRSGDEGMER